MPGTNWWVDAGEFLGMPGGATVGGGGTSEIRPRSPMDAARMASQLAPGASYPDGYLGTITDRRQDRLMGAVQDRMTDKAYQRGVHKGEKMGQGAYYWTSDVNPDAGIKRESMARLDIQEGGIVYRVQRHAPTLDAVEKLTALGKRATLTPEQEVKVSRQFGVDPGGSSVPLAMTDPGTVSRMQRDGMLPSYR
jgi:hypothetical protein